MSVASSASGRLHMGLLEEEVEDDVAFAGQRRLFIRLVVHEMSGRLSAIKMLTQLTQIWVDQEDHAKAIQHLSKLANNVSRLEVIVKDMTELGRIQFGQFSLRKQRFDLKELCLDVAEEQALITGRHIEVDLPPCEVGLEGDPERIGQVLINLISNAHKYSSDAGKIWLVLRVDGTKATIRLQDEGPGIAKEQLAEVFNLFFRIPGHDGLPDREGLGLGLYICKTLVDAHRGRIWVESNPGQGAAFSFTLPLR